MALHVLSDWRTPMQKRYAFLVHEPVMLAHYADVWKLMNPSAFTIVITDNFFSDGRGNEKLGTQEFLSYVQTEGYEVRTAKAILSNQIKFKYVITNHPISAEPMLGYLKRKLNQVSRLLNEGLRLLGIKLRVREFGAQLTYLPQRIGKNQIRYMYGADISEGWSLQGWNNIYDVFLCHGVNDEREIRKRFKGKTFIMGYPRYDRFFSGEMDLSSIRREFGLCESKKTVLWMPTLGGDYSSIPLFAEALSTVSENYNIIVRPHPISFVQEKTFVSLLEKLNFNIDRNAVRDMSELFGVADVVLADNGGTPFSAIFLGKSVIFLDVPDDLGSESAATYYIAGSSVMELKKYLPVISNQEMGRLVNMLDSELFYKENSKCIETLFKRYFDSPRGGGAKRAVDILNGLD